MKWYKIMIGEGSDRESTNCALCAEYFDYKEWSCTVCPVALAGHPNCAFSPYTDWVNASRGRCKVNSHADLQAAVREFFFLLQLVLN